MAVDSGWGDVLGCEMCWRMENWSIFGLAVGQHCALLFSLAYLQILISFL